MGTQGEIYLVLGKRFQVERVNPDEELDDKPQELLYQLNGNIISISEDRPSSEYNFLDGFIHTKVDITRPQLGVKVIGVDHEYGDRDSNVPIREALVGYALANESYSANASPAPPLDKVLALREKVAADITKKLGLQSNAKDMGLHLLYEFSQ